MLFLKKVWKENADDAGYSGCPKETLKNYFVWPRNENGENSWYRECCDILEYNFV